MTLKRPKRTGGGQAKKKKESSEPVFSLVPDRSRDKNTDEDDDGISDTDSSSFANEVLLSHSNLRSSRVKGMDDSDSGG